ncbi:hypothetical protein J4G07_11110, partial [Candidatus Poribacteria bacterium]|nr:hypothetical protein [Candidatus Poribacteria bacterium]
TVCSRLAENKAVRRTLPDGGRLHIDRQLPFLCVYRYPIGYEDAGTERLVMGQPSYLIASADKRMRSSLSELTQNIVRTLSSEFGAFLIFEIWSRNKDENENDSSQLTRIPEFQIATHPNLSPFGTVDSRSQDEVYGQSCTRSKNSTHWFTSTAAAPISQGNRMRYHGS